MEIEQAIKELIDRKLEEYPKRREVYGIVRKAVSKQVTITGRIAHDSENCSLFSCNFSETEKRVSAYLGWSPEEDKKLRKEINAALGRIAVNHGRTFSAIRSRIHRMTRRGF